MFEQKSGDGNSEYELIYIHDCISYVHEHVEQFRDSVTTFLLHSDTPLKAQNQKAMILNKDTCRFSYGLDIIILL